MPLSRSMAKRTPSNICIITQPKVQMRVNVNVRRNQGPHHRRNPSHPRIEFVVVQTDEFSFAVIFSRFVGEGEIDAIANWVEGECGQ